MSYYSKRDFFQNILFSKNQRNQFSCHFIFQDFLNQLSIFLFAQLNIILNNNEERAGRERKIPLPKHLANGKLCSKYN